MGQICLCRRQVSRRSVVDCAAEDFRMGNVHPWWYAYFYDNRFRSIFLPPEKIYGRFVEPGMTALDAGCGMGFNTIAMAWMVGPDGRVIAVDIEPRMVEVLKKRARKAGLEDRIDARLSRPEALEVSEKVDFALAFWVVHETPDAGRFVGQVGDGLKEGARLMIVEPSLHVTPEEFEETVKACAAHGMRLESRPQIWLNRAAVFAK